MKKQRPYLQRPQFVDLVRRIRNCETNYLLFIFNTLKNDITKWRNTKESKIDAQLIDRHGVNGNTLLMMSL